MNRKDLALTLGQRLALLACITVICFMLSAAVAFLLGRVLAGRPAAALRISAVVQDVLCFIVPAVATSVIVTRRPAELLAVGVRPGALALGLIAAVAAVSVPAMDAVIRWNAELTFPASWAPFVELARSLEEQAAAAMACVLADTSVAGLVVNVLIIGIFAAFAEELFFRGCLQRLLATGGVNAHVAIWTVALVFSLMHFQLFGLVPRLLLGAYFGYLLLWTRSLWAPVAAHAVNNSVYVVAAWLQGGDIAQSSPSMPAALTAASAVLTAAALWLLRRRV